MTPTFPSSRSTSSHNIETFLQADETDEAADAADASLGTSSRREFSIESYVKKQPDNTRILLAPKSLTDNNFHQLFRSIEAARIDPNSIVAVDFSMCTKLTGSSLNLLGLQLRNVQQLNLTGCSQLTDADFFHLNLMNNMNLLSLAGCVQLSPQGFKSLSAILDNIGTLDLTGMPQLDDEFLSALKDMHQIRQLVLTGCTGFTNTGLSSVRELKNLETLLLDQCTQLTDESLLKLMPKRTLKNLVRLSLNNCPFITDRGIATLQKAKPQITHISHL